MGSQSGSHNRGYQEPSARAARARVVRTPPPGPYASAMSRVVASPPPGWRELPREQRIAWALQVVGHLAEGTGEQGPAGVVERFGKLVRQP